VQVLPDSEPLAQPFAHSPLEVAMRIGLVPRAGWATLALIIVFAANAAAQQAAIAGRPPIAAVAAAAATRLTHPDPWAEHAASQSARAVREHDSILNGLLIGAGAGAASGFLIAPHQFCDVPDSECLSG
jgi:hypothetical protein